MPAHNRISDYFRHKLLLLVKHLRPKILIKPNYDDSNIWFALGITRETLIAVGIALVWLHPFMLFSYLVSINQVGNIAMNWMLFSIMALDITMIFLGFLWYAYHYHWKPENRQQANTKSE